MAQKSALPTLAFIVILIQFMMTASSLPDGVYRFQYHFTGGGASTRYLQDVHDFDTHDYGIPYLTPTYEKGKGDWRIVNQPNDTIRLQNVRYMKYLGIRRDLRRKLDITTSKTNTDTWRLVSNGDGRFFLEFSQPEKGFTHPVVGLKAVYGTYDFGLFAKASHPEMTFVVSPVN
ncbi:hypothetical protein EDD21DRAFT_212678 [Dissophora ornata]|nr:hypothetical protein EDD21DRAFT_212678 [Dissophora ornata]